ncbi:hypothetical protein OSH11_01360 [Kaistia dalseonensis]|uniref:Uncharacterized protein n=1 Tax=Kaistia dalseonensis TaxID=410840 RepID=A0ABU0H0R8_9HYPH|nr:hypothetical protein [Kaistia dalseonensis]MCX5493344.1 hypothetical protein [Kaistia dalseonensis]MDQ0435901.1 hypothetical protein [Kaistia dalseonensis]
MFRRFILTAVTGVGLTLLTAGPGFAEDTPPVAVDPLNGAWADLAETEGDLLSGAQFTQLTSLAYQTAVVRVCDSHTLDKDAVGKALDKLLTQAEQKLAPEQQDERTAAILIAFGARYGLFIAEAHLDKKAFCESAAKLKDGSGNLPLFLK